MFFTVTTRNKRCLRRLLLQQHQGVRLAAPKKIFEVYRNIRTNERKSCKRMGESSTIIIVESSTRRQCHKQKNENSFEFSLWCHQKTSFISKWLYIFVLKNRNKQNLPLLLHLISALFCSVSQSRVPTLMQRQCFILKYKQMP